MGGGTDLEGRQRETEIHCRCQAPQIVRSKNPPNADFYQGSGLAQKVRVSIWKGCASAVQIFPRFLRLVQVSMGQSEFDEEGKGLMSTGLNLPLPGQESLTLLPTELTCLYLHISVISRSPIFFKEEKY